MKKLFLGILCSISFFTQAQTASKEVLFTVDSNPYYSTDFVRIYNKNLDLVKDESQKDLDKYLDLYIGYKLKVNKAHKLGLQNSTQYQNELKGYRSQLAKTFVTDKKVTQALIEEGYQRLQKEVNASHILLLCDENALPEDTLKIYNKAIEIRNRITQKGEDFEIVAQQTSEDPSAKDNKGNLGWFSAFRMVYPFESMAYNTKIGGVSQPVRTRFGYHIIKVNDIRANRGEIQVAHIMTMNAKEGEDATKPKTTIDEVYKKLQQGEKFEELAKQFSEDKSSAPKGGMLNRFGSGQLSSDLFENAAFSLTKENPVSAPIQSEYGWHIIKLIDRFPIKTLEESKIELENKISRDDRSHLISNSLTEKLRKKYSTKTDKKTLELVKKSVTEDYYDNKWELPTDLKPFEKKLLTIDKKNIDATDFLNYLKTQEKNSLKVKPTSKLVETHYSKYIDEQLNSYYDENLEKEFSEFAATMEEYRDGLLLFDLMDKEIWQRSKNDTIGLTNFYKNMKEKPMWKTRAQAIVISSTKEDMVNKALQLLKSGKKPQEIKDQLNTKEVVNIMIQENFYEENDATFPKNTKMEVGYSNITKNGDYYFATQILKILPAGEKTFDECKGKLVNEYQQYLEQHWVDELKKEFTVKVNQNVFEKLKNTIKK
jgi:peptidyl-prolyl cis-trans isomerase SurA